jgi:hypothetical protein
VGRLPNLVGMSILERKSCRSITAGGTKAEAFRLALRTEGYKRKAGIDDVKKLGPCRLKFGIACSTRPTMNFGGSNLICLLTAALAHEGTGAIIGEAEGGWFWLPPWSLWQPWSPEATALIMLTQLKPVASSPATNRRIKRSIVPPLRVTVYYLNFAPLKHTVPTPPAWLGGVCGR